MMGTVPYSPDWSRSGASTSCIQKQSSYAPLSRKSHSWSRVFTTRYTVSYSSCIMKLAHNLLCYTHMQVLLRAKLLMHVGGIGFS